MSSSRCPRRARWSSELTGGRRVGSRSSRARAAQEPAAAAQLGRSASPRRSAADGAARRLLREHTPDAVYVSTVTLPLWPLAAASKRVPSLVHLHEGEQAASRIVKSRDLRARGARPRHRRQQRVQPRRCCATPSPASPSARTSSTTASRARRRRPPARPSSRRPCDSSTSADCRPRKGPDLIVEALALLPAELGEVRARHRRRRLHGIRVVRGAAPGSHRRARSRRSGADCSASTRRSGMPWMPATSSSSRRGWTSRSATPPSRACSPGGSCS